MIYGYVRKLNKKESLDEQIKEIKANYPKATIIEEKNVSNARPKLKFMLNKATEGDIIVFSSLERFGIELEELYNVTQSLKENGVEVVVLNLPSDDLLMTLSAFKQFNKAMIVERTQLGRLKAMQKEDYKWSPNYFWFNFIRFKLYSSIYSRNIDLYSYFPFRF